MGALFNAHNIAMIRSLAGKKRGKTQAKKGGVDNEENT
jgi:hypothetical protein